MTYLLEGNDPTRTHEYLTPDEVKAMMTGDTSIGGYREADRTEDPDFRRPPEEAADENVMVWLYGERTMDESHRLAKTEGRCPTCGRQSDCCCQGCPTCSQDMMAEGKISAAWAKIQVALGDIDPREMA